MNAIFNYNLEKIGSSKYYIPLISQNSGTYYLHYMMSAIGKLKDKKFGSISNNISFSFNNLHFIISAVSESPLRNVSQLSSTRKGIKI